MKSRGNQSGAASLLCQQRPMASFCLVIFTMWFLSSCLFHGFKVVVSPPMFVCVLVREEGKGGRRICECQISEKCFLSSCDNSYLHLIGWSSVAWSSIHMIAYALSHGHLRLQEGENAVVFCLFVCLSWKHHCLPTPLYLKSEFC